MRPLIILLALFIVSQNTYCQIITFTDLELKDYLLNEPCAHTSSTPEWGTLFDVDINNDNEIQVSEALAIKYINVADASLTYSIQSLDDLVQFENLVSLDVAVPILEFDRIQLDNLKSLSFIDIGLIRKIDISNLPNLTGALRIEGITTLDTLNIKNGSVTNLFSLFYTQNIKYACVDNIASEYNAFGTFTAMYQDTLPSINCVTLSITGKLDEKISIDIFPNPTNGLIEFKTNNKIIELQIFNIIGASVFQTKNVGNSIDISNLNSGVYFFKVRVNDKYVIKRVIMN